MNAVRRCILTATEIVYGLRSITARAATDEPTHMALAVMEWEDDRTDIHSGGYDINADGTHTYTCVCGFETGPLRSHHEGSAQLISHALHTCARCQGPKTADQFPLGRCCAH